MIPREADRIAGISRGNSERFERRWQPETVHASVFPKGPRRDLTVVFTDDVSGSIGLQDINRGSVTFQDCSQLAMYRMGSRTHSLDRLTALFRSWGLDERIGLTGFSGLR
jgi:hypothetical protein